MTVTIVYLPSDTLTEDQKVTIKPYFDVGTRFRNAQHFRSDELEVCDKVINLSGKKVIDELYTTRGVEVVDMTKQPEEVEVVEEAPTIVKDIVEKTGLEETVVVPKRGRRVTKKTI